MFTDLYQGLRIVSRFVPVLGEEACGLFMDLDRIWGRRLSDCLWIWTGFGGEGLRIVYGFFSGCGGRGLRIVYGFLPDVEDEAYGLFTDLYRIWGRRLADCLWIWTGFGGGGLRIVYGFGPDLGEEACGLFTGFGPDIWRTKAYGLFTDLYRFWGRRLADCLWIWTGFGGGGLRIVYGFGPDLGDEEACGLFMDLDWDLGEKAYGLFTDFFRMWRTRLTDCLRIFTGCCGGRGLRIVYGFVPDLGEEACGLFMDLDIFGPDLEEKAYGFLTDLCFLADGFCTDFCRSAYGLLGLKRVLVGAGEENHPPEEDVKKMRF